MLQKYPLSEKEERIQDAMDFRWESESETGFSFEDVDDGSGDNDGSKREIERIR